MDTAQAFHQYIANRSQRKKRRRSLINRQAPPEPPVDDLGPRLPTDELELFADVPASGGMFGYVGGAALSFDS